MGTQIFRKLNNVLCLNRRIYFSQPKQPASKMIAQFTQFAQYNFKDNLKALNF